MKTTTRLNNIFNNCHISFTIHSKHVHDWQQLLVILVGASSLCVEYDRTGSRLLRFRAHVKSSVCLRGLYAYVLHRRGPSSELDVFALHPASIGTSGLEIARWGRVFDVSMPGETTGCPHLRMHGSRASVVHHDRIVRFWQLCYDNNKNNCNTSTAPIPLKIHTQSRSKQNQDRQKSSLEHGITGNVMWKAISKKFVFPKVAIKALRILIVA